MGVAGGTGRHAAAEPHTESAAGPAADPGAGAGAGGDPGAGSELSHVDARGAARMVDVSGKPATTRTATASGVLHTTAQVVELVAAGSIPKGDVLATARIAGIMAAKRTSELIPLCHPLPLSAVQVDVTPAGHQLRITATVRTTGATGVEMEALTAVAVAGLTLHDMIKAVDPAATLDEVRVDRKEGGKTGSWTRAEQRR
ncbi:cyclic pyranopterin monophosphate synthase MoaC [Nakamurella aerolata]|uniref:Cyclic pyranopterin monophosphate synthase n=1 Tax=Nakamurella aerolata TaxID=1656892 RepID=A0A849A8J6_9ACTN|nr:cyclic pyranopterin monophosphate synthase MoaC [Nakamurella aerolata]NNG35401.1 cyclic pyranopterin monophosphate synthase MoaC [Nakamurella aerolata]